MDQSSISRGLTNNGPAAPDDSTRRAVSDTRIFIFIFMFHIRHFSPKYLPFCCLARFHGLISLVACLALIGVSV